MAESNSTLPAPLQQFVADLREKLIKTETAIRELRAREASTRTQKLEKNELCPLCGGPDLPARCACVGKLQKNAVMGYGPSTPGSGLPSNTGMGSTGGGGTQPMGLSEKPGYKKAMNGEGDGGATGMQMSEKSVKVKVKVKVGDKGEEMKKEELCKECGGMHDEGAEHLKKDYAGLSDQGQLSKKAPPDSEKLVHKLKDEYGHDEEGKRKAFATAWAIHNKTVKKDEINATPHLDEAKPGKDLAKMGMPSSSASALAPAAPKPATSVGQANKELGGFKSLAHSPTAMPATGGPSLAHGAGRKPISSMGRGSASAAGMIPNAKSEKNPGSARSPYGTGASGHAGQGNMPSALKDNMAPPASGMKKDELSQGYAQKTGISTNSKPFSSKPAKVSSILCGHCGADASRGQSAGQEGSFEFVKCPHCGGVSHYEDPGYGEALGEARGDAAVPRNARDYGGGANEYVQAGADKYDIQPEGVARSQKLSGGGRQVSVVKGENDMVYPKVASEKPAKGSKLPKAGKSADAKKQGSGGEIEGNSLKKDAMAAEAPKPVVGVSGKQPVGQGGGDAFKAPGAKLPGPGGTQGLAAGTKPVPGKPAPKGPSALRRAGSAEVGRMIAGKGAAMAPVDVDVSAFDKGPNRLAAKPGAAPVGNPAALQNVRDDLNLAADKKAGGVGFLRGLMAMFSRPVAPAQGRGVTVPTDSAGGVRTIPADQAGPPVKSQRFHGARPLQRGEKSMSKAVLAMSESGPCPICKKPEAQCLCKGISSSNHNRTMFSVEGRRKSRKSR